MKYNYFVRTNMIKFPNGLLEHLPQGLVGFEMAVSDLSAIPDELSSKWGHSLSVVYLEHCAFTEFPSSLTHFHVQEISLFGNSISSMASVKFGDGYNLLTTLMLVNMPLHDFPAMVPENNQKLEWVSVENTQISSSHSGCTQPQLRAPRRQCLSRTHPSASLRRPRQEQRSTDRTQ